MFPFEFDAVMYSQRASSSTRDARYGARRKRLHPLTAPARRGRWSRSGRKASRVSTASGRSNKRQFAFKGRDFSGDVRVGEAR